MLTKSGTANAYGCRATFKGGTAFAVSRSMVAAPMDSLYYLSSTSRCDHSARSDQTQLNAFEQSVPVESDCKSDHSESSAVITLTIFPD